MISYKVKGIILAVILSLASIMMPFSVYADTIDSHIRGRNYTYEPITYNEIQLSTNTYYQNIGIFHITFELDDEYIGYVLPNYTIQYDNYFYGAQTPNWGTLNSSFDRRIFVNGSSFSFDLPVNWNSITINSAPGGDPFNYDSYSITSSDVTKYADIDSLDQIINLLDDLYNSNDQVEGLLNDQLAQLQLIVQNTSLANQYLDDISKIRDWNIPMESYPFVLYMLNHYEPVDFGVNDISYINNYPIFEIPSNSNIYVTYGGPNSDYYFIFISSSNIYNLATLKNKIGFSRDDVEFTNWTNLGRGRWWSDNGVYYMIKATIHTDTSNLYSIINISSDTLRIIPIYFGNTQSQRISTDFALQYGLSNQLLDDIHIIAQGTNQSNSAASDLESEASEYSEIADDVIGVEEGLTSSFETEVNKIDLDTGLNVFGGNFMTSATWVRTQFDRLTENTPYGSLLVYGLTLGFALLMLGKVFL